MEELAVAQLPIRFETHSQNHASQASAEILIQQILEAAIKKRATDIHFDPASDNINVRFRIDGCLEIQNPISQSIYPLVLQRFKMMATQEIDSKEETLEGQFDFPNTIDSVDIRFSSLSALYGEAITLRILPKNKKRFHLNDLGLLDDMRATIADWLQKKYGWILVVGPTGAGKTTTLYAMLQELIKTESKIITIEDPVEVIFPEVTQVSISPDLGLDFPQVLRAAVRQAPNVLLIGEIRDALTAEIALNAALTGHLVLASMHAENTQQAIERLVYFGLNRAFINEILLGVLAERLVPRSCKANESEPHPDSCICEGRGFHGRVGLFECLSVKNTDAATQYNCTSFESDLDQKISLGWVTPVHLKGKQLFRESQSSL